MLRVKVHEMYISVWWLLVSPHQQIDRWLVLMIGSWVHAVLFCLVSSHEETDCSDILVSVYIREEQKLYWN